MAIKSFQGQRAEQPEKGTPIMVKDYMVTKLISFKPNQSVIEAMEILVKNKISGGPVIDEQDELVGIISEGDCLKQISQSKYFNMPMSEIKVKDYMVKEVKTIDAFVTIFEAADYFLNNKIRRFPVIRHGKLVGQISQKDILEAVLKVTH